MKAILIAALLALAPGQALGHHEHEEVVTSQPEQSASTFQGSKSYSQLLNKLILLSGTVTEGDQLVFD